MLASLTPILLAFFFVQASHVKNQVADKEQKEADGAAADKIKNKAQGTTCLFPSVSVP
jgi:hypothetical protein